MKITKDNFEFSFDDWYIDDPQFAEFLYENGYKNVIFYIPIKNIEWKEILNKDNIKKISEIYEIWWHTYNHIDLTSIPLKQAKKEILDWKKAIENIIWKSITSFCPPRWHFNDEILELVKECWFTDCRSARLYNSNNRDKTNFVWHPNIHYYNHRLIIDLLHSIKMKDIKSFNNRIKNINKSHKEMIIEIIKNNWNIHIWWHTWEIDFQEFKKFILELNQLLDV